jgi:hypothetical protein
MAKIFVQSIPKGLNFYADKLSYGKLQQALFKLGVIAASGRPLAWVRTFGVCVGLPCMCAKVCGWPPCQRKAIRMQPNAL